MSALTPILIEGPGDDPITVEEARAHLEAQPYFDSDTDPIDDAMIALYIGAAREQCEDFLGLSLSPRVLEVGLDRFPSSRRSRDIAIDLPFGPVRDVVAVAWGDESDDELAGDEFIVDRYRPVHQIKPLAASWPATTAPGPVRIRYKAGYGFDSDLDEDMPVPKAILAAMLLIVGHLFENRAQVTDGIVTEIPNGAMVLLRPKRVRLGMA